MPSIILSGNRNSWMTILFMAISIAMFFVVFYTTESFDPEAAVYIPFGACWAESVKEGEYWRLLTCSFLHAGIEHILLNMICLYTAGRLLEMMIGHFRFGIVYILTAIAGAICSCCYHPDSVCVGASGAVFGIFGASLVYVIFSYRKLGINATDAISYIKESVICLSINFLYSLSPGVDLSAHVGGFLAGCVLGALFAYEALFFLIALALAIFGFATAL